MAGAAGSRGGQRLGEPFDQQIRVLLPERERRADLEHVPARARPADEDAALAQEIEGKLDTTMEALGAIKAAAEGGMAYDSMLEAGNAEGEALVMAGVDGLIDQTHSFERAIAALGLETVAFEGSESLDNPDAVFQ